MDYSGKAVAAFMLIRTQSRMETATNSLGVESRKRVSRRGVHHGT